MHNILRMISCTAHGYVDIWVKGETFIKYVNIQTAEILTAVQDVYRSKAMKCSE